MSFQKCPKCEGSGSTGIGFPTGKPCNVCVGTGIIDELTGYPPEDRTRYTDNTGNMTQQE